MPTLTTCHVARTALLALFTLAVGAGGHATAGGPLPSATALCSIGVALFVYAYFLPRHPLRHISTALYMAGTQGALHLAFMALHMRESGLATAGNLTHRAHAHHVNPSSIPVDSLAEMGTHHGGWMMLAMHTAAALAVGGFITFADQLWNSIARCFLPTIPAFPSVPVLARLRFFTVNEPTVEACQRDTAPRVTRGPPHALSGAHSFSQ